MKKKKQKKIKFIKTFIYCLIGYFIGFSIYLFIDYKTNTGKYLVQSAPWYTNILLIGLMEAIIIAICLIVIKKLKK